MLNVSYIINVSPIGLASFLIFKIILYGVTAYSCCKMIQSISIIFVSVTFWFPFTSFYLPLISVAFSDHIDNRESTSISETSNNWIRALLPHWQFGHLPEAPKFVGPPKCSSKISFLPLPAYIFKLFIENEVEFQIILEVMSFFLVY